MKKNPSPTFYFLPKTDEATKNLIRYLNEQGENSEVVAKTLGTQRVLVYPVPKVVAQDFAVNANARTLGILYIETDEKDAVSIPTLDELSKIFENDDSVPSTNIVALAMRLVTQAKAGNRKKVHIKPLVEVYASKPKNYTNLLGVDRSAYLKLTACFGKGKVLIETPQKKSYLTVIV